MAIDPRNLFKKFAEAEEITAPLSGTRAQRMQRLQVGLFGLGAMVLMIALADIVTSRARETEEASVPELAPVAEESPAPAPRDPLADAGVVPEVPVETPKPAPAAPQEMGDVLPPAL